MSVLTIKDIQIISDIMSEKINDLDKKNQDRLNVMDDSFALRLKMFQISNEESHERLLQKMDQSEQELRKVQEKQDFTNGKVRRHESYFNGDKNLNEPGLLQNYKEIKKYRFLYKNIFVFFFIISGFLSLMIPEVKDFLIKGFSFLRFLK